MQFLFPWMFLLFVPLAIVAYVILRARKQRGVLFASASKLPAQRKTWRYCVARWFPVLFLVGLSLLIVAAAGPRKLLSREVVSGDALAVMMGVDVSGSMLGLDLSENATEKTRLQVVKEVFREYVKKRPDDLIGLVAFGGYASVRSPLTADHAALLHTLAGVEVPGAANGMDALGRPVSNDEQMTAMGDGLAVCLLRLADAEPKTKIVILLSDGESNTGELSPIESAQMAAEMGVRVYTIGVGSTGLTKVRMTDRSGRSVLVDVQMTLDEETLNTIAQTTGGVYANVRSSEQLTAALEEISRLETTRVERQVYTRYRELTPRWILAGASCILLASLGLITLLRRPI